ncbi:RsmB/NOP family class I SAM-dependent RNA methyltransferase [Nocardioides jiangxiensis]|uniref:Transcription antitermination factor NusB n=1 Tax=Nocardioides jiangxiensis TaxID=3064524 RepID=A0ABT9AXA4_9ACTN|nr:transcription antitermination factor NusB [Nocardioides sp. WY-20]MDO7866873.1 transcription antitermination factor NusB [Nocardioides sp. WY-20]
MADPRRRGRPGPSSGGRPPKPRPAADPSRLAAYDVMTAVRLDGAYTNLLLPQVLRKYGLSGRDAGFVTELVSGTIRRQGTYDVIIGACADRPVARIEAKVLDALRLGAHQLLAMRVPSHAAISTTVDLVRSTVGQGPAGFTNAVLRRVSEHPLDEWIRLLGPTKVHAFAAFAHSHPLWVVDTLAEALAATKPADMRVELDALLAADNAAPKVMLVARPGLATLDELIAAGGEPTGRSPYAVELGGGDPSAIPAVAEGRAGVQDEGSQRVALALAAAPLDGRDELWLDLCAGPGGKTALLAAVAAQRGALVVANERQHHRARLVADGTRAAAAGLAGVITGDGTRRSWASGSFDRVLVDAPCSGLGALRRRPEARWRKTADEVQELVPLQQHLLATALDSVRPGGVVVYATCSPVLAETRDVVDAVLAGRDDTTLERTEQLWPHRHGSDAMYFAVLRRAEA